MLMFTDEAHKDERTHDRLYGYASLGIRCAKRATWVRGKRISILPVLTLDGIIAYDLVEGSVSSDRFVEFIREQVVSTAYVCSLDTLLLMIDRSLLQTRTPDHEVS